MKRTLTGMYLPDEVEGKIPNESELKELSVSLESMDSMPTTPLTPFDSRSAATPISMFDSNYQDPDYQAESNPSESASDNPQSTQTSLVLENLTKEDTVIAKRIKLLEKGICYVGYKTDHLIFWFADEKDLRQLAGLIITHKNRGSNLETDVGKDFARFFKLTPHIMIVFYESHKLFLSAALQVFLEKAIEQIKPFVAISNVLKSELVEFGGIYFAALKKSYMSEWGKNENLGKLCQYFQPHVGEFLKSSQVNVGLVPTKWRSQKPRKPKVSFVATVNEDSSKKRKFEESEGVVDNKIDLLKKSTCYWGKTDKADKAEETDHLIFWFEDKNTLNNLMDQLGSYSRRNPQADNTKDFSHFFKLSDHAMAVFYVQRQFISPALKIAFKKILKEVKPFKEISADLDKDLVSCEGKSLRMLKSYRKSELGKGGYLDKLCKHYDLPPRNPKKKRKKSQKTTENFAKENDRSFASTSFLDSMDWRTALNKLVTVEPVRNNDLSKEEVPQVTGEETPKIPEFK